MNYETLKAPQAHLTACRYCHSDHHCVIDVLLPSTQLLAYLLLSAVMCGHMHAQLQITLCLFRVGKAGHGAWQTFYDAVTAVSQCATMLR